MPAFEYRSLDHRGKVKRGTLEADSARQVRHRLRAKGWVPLEVSEARDAGKGGGLSARLSGSGKLKGGEQALITRQMATLLRSALPVEQALAAVARQAGNARVEKIVMAVRGKVLEGYSLARALTEYPRAFPEMYRATVAAGEQSGHLEQVLEQLADYLETRDDTGRSVSQAMIYPAFIMVFSALVIGFLMAFVVPKMVAVFSNSDQQLPFITEAVIWLSHFAREWGWLVVLLLIGGVFLFARAMREPAFRLQVHRKLVELPLVGAMLRASDSSRLASTLGILGRSGVPLVDALFIAAQVVGNMAIRKAVVTAAGRVREGGSLSRALEDSGYFPPMLVQMIASGETSGELDAMLSRAASYQERELDSTVQTLVGLLGPIMLLVMAGFVVLIVLAVMLPILQMNNFITG